MKLDDKTWERFEKFKDQTEEAKRLGYKKTSSTIEQSEFLRDLIEELKFNCRSVPKELKP